MRNLDKFYGCLLGGAAGDALGYEVEFMQAEDIFRRFGEKGITHYVLHNGIAQISDDTQMTLFTAAGLLTGTTRGMTRGIMGPYYSYIAAAYQDWLRTQQGGYPEGKERIYTWLARVPELYNRRAPGLTCLDALERGGKGTISDPINRSKGCGGVMRVAPIGLYFVDKRITPLEVAQIGAEAAALTHGHELGYIPAAALVHLIFLLTADATISLKDAILYVTDATIHQFSTAFHISEFSELMKKAVELSECDMDDLDAIRMIGQGWVAEETLAIAFYCALKHCDNFDEALIAAVNHDGDSDSTGSVTGNILGAYLGLSGIPQKYIENLELKDVIMEIATDLCHDCQIDEYSMDKDPAWVRKYVRLQSPFL